MATLSARGTARISFSDVTVEVEIDDQVAEAVGDELGGQLQLEDIEIDSVEFESSF